MFKGFPQFYTFQPVSPTPSNDKNISHNDNNTYKENNVWWSMLIENRLTNSKEICFNVHYPLGNFAKVKYPARLNPEKIKLNVFRREQLNYSRFSFGIITIQLKGGLRNEKNYEEKS